MGALRRRNLESATSLPSGQGSFLHLAVKNVWGKSRFWEWFVRTGAVSLQAFGDSSSVLVLGGPGGTEGFIPSCAELLEVPGCGIHAGHNVWCHQCSCVTSLRFSSCAEPCPGPCVTSLDAVTGRSVPWGQVLSPQWCGGQSGRGQTQLTWLGPSLAEPEADSESFIDVQGALGCDLMAPNPCVLLPGGWGPWWGQQERVGGLCLEGETPTTVRDCHQKLVGFKVLNLRGN